MAGGQCFLAWFIFLETEYKMTEPTDTPMSTEKDQPTPSKELPARYVTPQRVGDRLTGAAV